VVRRCGVGPGHAAVLLVRPRADEAVRRCPQLRWGAQEGTRLAPGDVIDERHGCPPSPDQRVHLGPGFVSPVSSEVGVEEVEGETWGLCRDRRPYDSLIWRAGEMAL
jgi:hypothetical protein